jgi:hypothetical protein
MVCKTIRIFLRFGYEKVTNNRIRNILASGFLLFSLKRRHYLKKHEEQMAPFVKKGGYLSFNIENFTKNRK